VGVEREIKVTVPAGFVLPDLDGTDGLRAVDRGVQILETTYWDTDSLALLRSHQGLRHRVTDGAAGGIWTLKAKTHRDGIAVVREETEMPGGPEAPPREAVAMLAGSVDPAALHPVARLRAERHIVDLLDGAARWAEVDDDTVAVLDGEREVSRFREVEVEIHGADDADRGAAVVARLRAAGGGEPESSSKYVRALRALGHTIDERSVS
jgi:inorganic triphosphatase YgiF